LENKIDELTSLIKALDTKIMFLMEDIEQIKTDLEYMKAVQSQQPADSSQADQHKAQRLAAFKEQSQRW